MNYVKFKITRVIFIFSFFSDEEFEPGRKHSNALKSLKKLNLNWEPYFCVLLQDEQTFTAYRSEDLSVSFCVDNCFFFFLLSTYFFCKFNFWPIDLNLTQQNHTNNIPDTIFFSLIFLIV